MVPLAPPTRTVTPTSLGLHGHVAGGVVAQRDAELGVELGLVSRVGGGEHGDDVPHCVHECLDLLGGQLAAGDVLAELPLEGSAFALCLVDPLRGESHGVLVVED